MSQMMPFYSVAIITFDDQSNLFQTLLNICEELPEDLKNGMVIKFLFARLYRTTKLLQG